MGEIVFLTEAGKKIGLGHLTRSISISQGFEAKGRPTRFIVNADTDVRAVLKGKKYQIFDWLKNKTNLWQQLSKASIVVVDSYLAPLSFYKELSRKVALAVYVDDYGRLAYPSGVVLNGCMGGVLIRYPKAQGVDHLLGPRYMPLRREFWKTVPKKIAPEVKNILVTVGGYDAFGLTQKITDLLKEVYPRAKHNIVAGKHISASAMRGLMQKADLAVSAGGQTLYELACTGLPAVVIRVADNQRFNVEGLSKVGSIILAGQADDKNILNKLRRCLENSADPKGRRAASRKGRACVDGKGSLRIATELLKKERLCRNR